MRSEYQKNRYLTLPDTLKEPRGRRIPSMSRAVTRYKVRNETHDNSRAAADQLSTGGELVVEVILGAVGEEFCRRDVMGREGGARVRLLLAWRRRHRDARPCVGIARTWCVVRGNLEKETRPWTSTCRFSGGMV
ncbi:hypothetical protein JTB14_033444 [Gonioctena quinquepunctata]|nr:hypothetical protein JTB14_033444 [Gonioctena quinquepunctata]